MDAQYIAQVQEAVAKHDVLWTAKFTGYTKDEWLIFDGGRYGMFAAAFGVGDALTIYEAPFEND